jgi:MarR family transcriptional regulator, organic hydroperoxide resistance regulator
MSRRSTFSKLPLTATRPVLLRDKSDHVLRELVYNFFTLANRMEEIRHHIGSRIGLSGPQYTLMMAVAELQGSVGVSVGQVAEYLHVTGTFVAAESGKLSRMGYINKAADTEDGRVSLLSVGQKGWTALQSLFPELQQINDSLFDVKSRTELENLHGTLKKMVDSSKQVLARIHLATQSSGLKVLASSFSRNRQAAPIS